MKKRFLFLLFGLLQVSYLRAQLNASQPVFENVECFLNNCTDIRNQGKIEFGFLRVPENRENPQNRYLKLAVVILRAKSSFPKSDPIIYLNGGPGVKTLQALNMYKNHYLRQDRDFILLDFRGVGYSEPTLCPDLPFKIFEMMAQNLSPAQEIQRKKALYMECVQDLEKQAVDLSAYNTASIAADIRDLCAALGYQTYNLYGISHGTRIALAMMRDFPQGIRSVILDSSAPIGWQTLTGMIPNFDRSLGLLFRACEEDSKCRLNFPDLEKDFYEVLQNLEENPLELHLPLTNQISQEKFYINAQDFALTLQQTLYTKSGYASAPWLIKAFKDKNLTVLQNLFSDLPERLMRVDWGMQLLVNAFDLSYFQKREVYLQEAQNFPLIADKLAFFEADLEVFKDWKYPVDTRLENIPVKSTIPTLILAGTVDPVTPPINGRFTHRYLPQSFYVEFPMNGHGVSVSGECARQITERFIDNPRAAPSSDCLAEISPLHFQTEVYENGYFFSLLQDMLAKRNLFFVIGFAFAFVISISPILGWPTMLLMNKLRHRTDTEQVSESARWTASLTALLSFIFLLFLMQFTLNAFRENSSMLLFGLPVPSTLFFIIPYFLCFGTLGMVFFTIQAWKKLWWKVGGRIHYSMLTGVNLALLVFYYYYNLFL
ncbi:MAG: alpha/beta fold hydrolase [Microscillaceae bacterium]|nr:alpha/beta fold hydrolase [Microscillaceae bacterium]